MQFQFLGTSSGVPTRQRNVSGFAIRHAHQKSWVLVDCGEGTQHQLQQTEFTLRKLKAICITHVHGDHTFGLPGLISSCGMSGRKEPLTIIAPKDVEHYVRSALQLTDCFIPFDLNFVDVELFNEPREIAGFILDRFPLSHRVPSFAFRFSCTIMKQRLNTEKLTQDNVPKGPLWGELRAGKVVKLDDGRVLDGAKYVETTCEQQRVVVGGDNDTPELLAEACQECDVLVHEATFTKAISDKVGPGPQHTDAAQIGAFAQRVNLPHLVLTHFSARFQSSNMHEIQDETASFYQGQLFLANDFDKFQLQLGKLICVKDDSCD